MLVFATAVAIPPGAFRGLSAKAGLLLASVLAGAVALPALA